MPVYSLFSGRHKLPENNGALFSDFDFNTFKGVETENYNKAIETLNNGGTVAVIVTGLTPALTQFIAHAFRVRNESPHRSNATLSLQHYDRESGDYKPQNIF
jgi:hypothetical protein